MIEKLQKRDKIRRKNKTKQKKNSYRSGLSHFPKLWLSTCPFPIFMPSTVLRIQLLPSTCITNLLLGDIAQSKALYKKGKRGSA